MNQQHMITQLLTLFFSGVYITNKDLLDIAQKLDIEFPAKSRELILKNLMTLATEQKKEQILYDLLISLLQQRISEYKKLTNLYPSIAEVSSNWVNRANTMIRLLAQNKRGNIYE
ncbi:hypothetical protein [Arcobacter sp. FWKO B]|uniref:hypothetical protein n=1 Tax=Arcobacter sp. FWKO B TaxID=2593672 RepID=UPI0018A50EB3|nr:hypothetical protein [Arcobacter sp. FWKO B]QOG12403.1 hypothetical protein FWKOB_06685 [Arcobacter sp. FWKO B]